MAVEKAALDLSVCSMDECRKGLDNATDMFEKAVKDVTKAAVRRRIRKAAETVKFDLIPLPKK